MVDIVIVFLAVFGPALLFAVCTPVQSPPRSAPPRPRTQREREEFTRGRLRLAEEVLLARGNPHAVQLAEEIRRGRERRERTWAEEGR